jgi:hypothetical protein
MNKTIHFPFQYLDFLAVQIHTEVSWVRLTSCGLVSQQQLFASIVRIGIKGQNATYQQY